MSATVQVKIGGIDVSTFQQEDKLKISSSQGGTLEKFDTADLELHDTGNFYLTLISDTVNRADNSTSIGSTERPQIPYTKQGTVTTWAVVSKKITVTAHDGAATFGEVITAQTASGGFVDYPNGIYDNCSISADVYLKSGDSSGAGLAVRVQGANNYIYAYLDSTTTITLGQRVGGVNTFLSSASSTSFVSGGNIRVDLSGNSISVYYTPSGSTSAIFATGGTTSAGNTNSKHGYWVSTSASTTGGHSFKNLLITPLYSSTYINLVPMEYKEIIIKDLSVPETIFGGIIDYTKPFTSGGLDFGRKVTAKDYSYLLEMTAIYKQYTNSNDGAIIQDIINSYFPFSYFDITNVNTTMSIPSFQANYTTALEAIHQLCAITGCQFYIDFTKKIYYGLNLATAAPCSFDEATGAFSNSSVRAFKMLDYERNMRALATRAIVIGGQDSVTNYSEVKAVAGGSPQLTSWQLIYGNITNISSFYSVNNVGAVTQVAYAYLDKSDPRKTPVEPNYTDPVTGQKDWTSSTFGLSTVNSLTLSPGEKIVIYRSSTDGGFGYRSNYYHFEGGFTYTLAYTDGKVTIKKSTSTAFTYVTLNISSDNSPIFTNSDALLFIGEGWPTIVDATTGLITYTPTAGGFGTGPDPNNTHHIAYSGSRQYIVNATRADTRQLYGGALGLTDPGDGSYRYFDVIVKNDKLTDTASITALARSTLLTQGNGIKTVRFQTWYGQGLRVGQVISLNAPSWQVTGTFIIRKIDISFMGGNQVSYTIEAGDYNPDNIDLTANLLRQQVDYNLTPNAATTVGVSVNYTNMTLHYYDDGTVYGQANAFWG